MVGLEEQLEIDKLHERELTANKSGEFDVLYNDVKNDNDVQQTLAENPPDDAESADTPVDPDTDVDPDADAEPTDEPVDEEVTEATESIKELTYAPEAIGAVITAATDLAATLGTIGIQYTAYAAKHIYKGVVYVFGKIARLLYTSTFVLKKYLERRVNSFDNLKSSIVAMQKTLKEIQDKSEAVDPEKLSAMKYSSLQIINSLKSGESVNFTENINQLKEFVETSVKGMSTQISNESSAILHIMSSARSGNGKMPSNLMAVHTEAVGLSEAKVDGYEPASAFVTTYRSDVPLPGDVILIAALPRPHIEEFEEIVKAYNDSSIVLGFDVPGFKKVEAVDYMTIEQLSGFLDSLNGLCDLCIEHQKVYEDIGKEKMYMKNSLKSFFMSLSNMNKKVTVKESFIEYIYLKAMFVDKVYMSSMIDIHDYVSKVIAAGTRYAKSNIEQLS